MTEDLPSRSPQAPPGWEAIARYHAGESPAEEAREVATWLAANPHDAALLAALDDAMERAIAERATEAIFHMPDVDVEAALRTVKARRDAEAPLAARDAGPPVVVSIDAARRRRVRVAWTVAGFAAAAGLVVWAIAGQEATGRAVAPSAVAVAGAPTLEPGRTFTTAVGRRDSVRLPDGTRVTLAPGSRLTLATGFGTGARDLTLEGQALFDVVHDATRPFTVHAGNALVRDVGTVFAVRTDGASAGAVTVAVTEGRVALQLAKDSMQLGMSGGPELAAGDRGVIGDGEVPVLARGVVTAADVAWATSGTLTYRAAPLATVAADLKRWYGIELKVDRALASRRLTATFTNEPVDEVVRVIALALGATATRDGDVVTLHPAGGGVR